MSEEQAPGLAGRTIGQYEMLREIGRGGMATVYLARQTSIGRDVAIKVLPDHLLTDATFMQRFVQEARVIADLQHPRVLPIYDFGELAHRPYLVMAYMSGGTLADRLRSGLLPLPEVVRLFEQMAEGLDHAHRKGVIHRDLKPSNILLDGDDNTYLADFGLAKVTESTVSLTGSNIVGTPSYMAPEMGSPRPVTHAADLYSLGITLYQMLSGDVPFRAQTPLEVMMAHYNEPVPDISEERPDLPTGLDEVLWRALAKDPNERYPTASALAADLRRVLASGGVVNADASSEPARPFNPPTPAVPKTVQLPGREGSTWEAARTNGIPPDGDWMEAGDESMVQTGDPSDEANPGCRWGLWVVLGGLLAILALVGGGAWAFVNGWGPFAGVVASESSFRGGAMSGGGVELAINNGLDEAICEVQIKLSMQSDWGVDQLGEDRQIAPGSAYTVTNIPPGEYDYRALNCDRDVLDTHYSVAMPEGSQLWNLYPANSTLTVQNDSRQAVCSVYVSAPFEGAWRGDKLGGGEALPPGESLDVAVAAGTWDLRAEACDGGVWEVFEMEMAGRGDWVLTDADLMEP